MINSQFNTIINVKILFFSIIYVFFAGIFLQFIIIPLMSLDAGSGLIKGGDWNYFHELAKQLASSISQQGWHKWVLRLDGQAPASAAAAIYTLTGLSKPWVLLPLHGILCGISSISIYSITQQLGASRNLSILSILPLFFFPSSAIIWGQIHKDIYSIAGVLLVLKFWISIWTMFRKSIIQNLLVHAINILTLIVGLSLMMFVRPYLFQVSLTASFSAAIILLISSCYRLFYVSSDSYISQHTCFLQCLLIIIMSLFIHLKLPLFFERSFQSNVDNLYSQEDLTFDNNTLSKIINYPPTNQNYPKILYNHEENFIIKCQNFLNFEIDKVISKISDSREGFRYGYPNARTNVDIDVEFNNIRDILYYLPRALQITFFSPFPNQLISDVLNLENKISSLVIIEMIIMYIAFPGIIILFFISSNRTPILIAFSFSLIFALAYTYVITNIGTIYRMRYPSMLIWIFLGIIGWGNLIRLLRTKSS